MTIEQAVLIILAPIALFLGSAPGEQYAPWLQNILPPEVRSGGLCAILMFLATRYGPAVWRALAIAKHPEKAINDPLIAALRDELRAINDSIESKMETTRARMDRMEKRIDGIKRTGEDE